MMDKALEIYRQRYETFRHLDKLRWQMILAAVASAASAAALRFQYKDEDLEWWLYALLGITVFVIGLAMNIINKGIRANSMDLSKAARAVGDYGIPDVSNKWKSIAHWIAVLSMVLGASLLFLSIHTAIYG